MTDKDIIMRLATLAHQSLSRQQGEVDAYEELLLSRGFTKTYFDKSIQEARDKAVSVDSAPLQTDYEYYMGYADGMENAKHWIDTFNQDKV